MTSIARRMLFFSFLTAVLAGAALVLPAAPAQAQPKDRYEQAMSARDHDAYRERMRAARTEEERQRIRAEYDARMRTHTQRGWRNSPPGGFPGNRPDMP